ncbi:hypothetical protein HMPREF9371_0014 [Neisseria shayeganii 871]|uniref:Uncharacterized protein n=1 Tax=Neisseria shayeganii 871 TaxID=1032488 RepID=G4CEH5_9NEIS|nr:hypothetical protein HMPREF9371_0014 [Neisseria shayeganii 871]
MPALGGHAAPFSALPEFHGFKTRARARRALLRQLYPDITGMVSTHVPARGGHPHAAVAQLAFTVSTHVPARGGHL